jgi:PAS domain S-box-containing protein
VDFAARNTLIAQLFLATGALYVLIQGLAVLLGWQDTILAVISSELLPMPRTGALNFVLIGISSLLLLLNQRYLSRIGSLIFMAIALERLAEQISGKEWNLLENISTAHSSTGLVHMPLAAVLSFIGIAIALILATLPHKYIYICIIEFLTSCVLSIAAANLLSYAVDMRSTASSENFARIPFLASIAFTIFGLSLFNYAFFLPLKEQKFRIGPLLGVLVGCLVMTFGVWNTFRIQGYFNLMTIQENEAQHVAKALEDHFVNIIKALNRINVRLQKSQDYERDLFVTDKENYLRDFNGLTSLEIVHTDLQANEKKVPFSALLEKYVQQEKLSEAIIPFPQREALILFYPLHTDQKKSENIFVAMLSLEKIMQKVTFKEFWEEYHFTISDNELLIYAGGGEASPSTVAIPHNIDLGLLQLTLRISPSKAFLQNQEGPLPKLILLLGILVTTLAGLTSYLSEVSQYRGKKLHAALQEKEEALAMRQALLDSSHYSIISTDQQGIITSFNKGATNLLGYTAEEMIGKSSLEILHDPDEVLMRAAELSQQFQKDIRPAFPVLVTITQKGIPEEREWTYIRKDNKRVPVLLAVTKFENNNTVGFLGIAHDLSEKKAIEEIRKDLIAVTTHELRSPLTAIKGVLDLLKGNEELPEEIRSLLEMADRNTTRLLALTNDLLDIQKIEAGKMEFYKSTIDLQSFQNHLVEMHQILAQQKGISLRIIQGPKIFIESDESRLMQVLVNLISNAIKFSPAGSVVEVSSSLKAKSVHIAVKDHGSGIPTEDQPRIFEKFYRGKGSYSKEQKGTGIGLAIAKSLIERLGGSIGFESSPQGTTFWIELPILDNGLGG